MHAKWVIAIVLLVLIALFTAQNYEVVEVRFLFWRLEMSRALLVPGVFALGVAIGWMLSSYGHLSRKREAGH
jgi:uncharacterized integral membrane protein